jgi:hypothetical protein
MSRWLVLATWLLAPALALPAPAPVLLSVGSQLGDPDDPPLKYANADARQVQALFTELGGVPAENAHLLADADATTVRNELDKLARITSPSSVLIVYLSAHAKQGQLHLRGSHLAVSELRTLARRVPARLRILIVDACDSGVVARHKGGRPGPSRTVEISGTPIRGEVVIASSGPAEPAQEWETLGGSLFTHHLITGLRGDADANGDGMVSLAEIYPYAYRRTVAEARGIGQHPTFDLDLSGAGDLALTWPSTGRASLIFPEELEGRFLVTSQPRAEVVSEIGKVRGRAVRLAVPPGRYLVRQTGQSQVGLLPVELPYGGSATVRTGEMTRRHYSEVLLKGGVLEARTGAALAFADLGAPMVLGSGARWQVGLGYRQTFGRAFAHLSFAMGWASSRAVAMAVRESSGTFQLSAGYRWLQTAWVPFAGWSVGAVAIEQRYRRDQEDQIQALNGRGLPPSHAVGLLSGPVVGVEVPLGSRGLILAQSQAALRYLRVSEQSPWTIGISGQLATGVRF